MRELHNILTTPGNGEHLDIDGLIHCDRCGNPRQVLLDFGSGTQTVRCLCSCQQAQLNKQRDQLRQQEEADRFQRMRTVAMRDPALRKCTFAASQYSSIAMTAARNYVSKWPHMQEHGLGLLLWGSPGTGKTYTAACIANALLDQKIPVLMTSFPILLGAMPGPVTGEQTAFIDQWMQYPLLIIDDLGVERSSEYTIELVYHIIDARYRSGGPMIITTNLTLNEMENPGTREKERIYDRILERCTPIRVEERQVRSEIRKENRSLSTPNLI